MVNSNYHQSFIYYNGSKPRHESTSKDNLDMNKKSLTFKCKITGVISSMNMPKRCHQWDRTTCHIEEKNKKRYLSLDWLIIDGVPSTKGVNFGFNEVFEVFD